MAVLMSEYKERFLAEYNRCIKRAGAAELLDWMDKRTDFFYAPASTRFHGAHAEGLVMHSLNVYDLMAARNEREQSEDAESVAAQTYGNIVAVKEGNENNPAVLALVEALKSDTIKQYIKDNYNGIVMPME